MLRELGLGSERLHAQVARLFERLAQPEDLLGESFYGVRAYAYYFLPEPDGRASPERELYISGLLWWLIRQHVEGKIEDATHFFEFVRMPHTYTGRLLPQAILEKELDLLAEGQLEDGGWPTPYAEHWRGPVTVQNLITLKQFGRV